MLGTNQTATARQPWEDEENPVRKRLPCIECNTNPKRSENSDHCQACWDKRLCKTCGKNKAGFPGNMSSSICHSCVRQRKPILTPQAKIDAARKEMFERGELCTRCKHASPEEGETLCFKCLHHEKPRKAAIGLKLMPETCMYGWLGEYARKLNCPPSIAYPAVLGVAAGYGVPSPGTIRTNLMVTLIGPKGSGKSVTMDRAQESWEPPTGLQVIRKYPGSEIGLIQLLGGKKHKDMDDTDYVPKPYLLLQDEMRLTLGKVNIQNSALPYAMNQLFYKDTFGTASKQGHWECCAKLTIIGGLTCENPDEFAEIYGVDTTTGMFDRTIFGVCPQGWDYDHENWQPPKQEDGDIIRRRSKSLSVSHEAYEAMHQWRDVDRAGRSRLGELALRVAVITASLNHESVVSAECMAKALEFMEWQESVRSKYKPSEMDDKDGRCQQAIVRALSLHEGWISWRDLCKKYNLHRHGATVLNRVKKAMIHEEMIEEEFELKDDGSRGARTGNVRLRD